MRYHKAKTYTVDLARVSTPSTAAASKIKIDRPGDEEVIGHCELAEALGEILEENARHHEHPNYAPEDEPQDELGGVCGDEEAVDEGSGIGNDAHPPSESVSNDLIRNH